MLRLILRAYEQRAELDVATRMLRAPRACRCLSDARVRARR